MGIFFDHSSTTPLDPEVLEAMLPFFKEDFGNPSSHIHELGQRALKAVDRAREDVASLIDVDPLEIVFTSGATESNNLAIKGLSNAYSHRGKHIIISQIEHYSVMNPAMTLKKSGFSVDIAPVDKYGVVDLKALRKLLKPDTILVSIMSANTEIGTIEPIKEAVEIVKSYNENIIFHTDATVSAGWIPTSVKETQVDALTLSAHNFYGPKGAGALFIRKGTKITPLLEGGFQEGGIRSGTENVPAIVGMAKAAVLAKKHMESRIKHLKTLQEHLWNGLQQKIEYLHFTGHPQKRLPGHVSFWVEFAEGESILLFLQVKGVMAASGSACSSNLRASDETELVKSHVLAAIGVPQDICSGSITFFMGKDNTLEEVNYVLDVMPDIIQRLWAMSPAYADMIKQKGLT